VLQSAGNLFLRAGRRSAVIDSTILALLRSPPRNLTGAIGGRRPSVAYSVRSLFARVSTATQYALLSSLAGRGQGPIVASSGGNPR